MYDQLSELIEKNKLGPHTAQIIASSQRTYKEKSESWFKVTLGDHDVNWLNIYKNVIKGQYRRDFQQIFELLVVSNDSIATTNLWLDGYRNEESIIFIEVLNEALIWAVRKNHLDTVAQLLADSRVDPCYQESEILLPVVENGYMEMMDLFIKDGRINLSIGGGFRDNNLYLKTAAEKGNLEMVIKLYNDPKVKSAAEDSHVIEVAGSHGHLHIVEWFLENTNVNPGAKDNAAIISTSMAGHLDIVNLLLNDKRVDPSAQNNLAVIYASCNNQWMIVDRLLKDEKVDSSDQDNEALRCAIANQCKFVIIRLIQDHRVQKLFNTHCTMKRKAYELLG